jgi:hypothetical protein
LFLKSNLSFKTIEELDFWQSANTLHKCYLWTAIIIAMVTEIAIIRPGHHPVLPHSPSNKPSQSREVRFDKVVTGILSLSCSIKSDMRTIQIMACHRGQHDAVLNQHSWVLPPWNLEIFTTLSTSFPFEWSTFSYLPCLVTITYKNKNIVYNHHILLVLEREVLHASGSYHSSSTDGYQLSITHLVIKLIHLHQG